MHWDRISDVPRHIIEAFRLYRVLGVFRKGRDDSSAIGNYTDNPQHFINSHLRGADEVLVFSLTQVRKTDKMPAITAPKYLPITHDQPFLVVCGGDMSYEPTLETAKAKAAELFTQYEGKMPADIFVKTLTAPKIIPQVNFVEVK